MELLQKISTYFTCLLNNDLSHRILLLILIIHFLLNSNSYECHEEVVYEFITVTKVMKL